VTTRILLADDHALVRRGLRLILDGEPDLRVVAEAGDGAEAVEKVAAGGVDLAILDIAMPRMTGLQAAREMTRRASDVRILMLSMYDNEQYFFEALKAGASGYVLKSVADQDLIAACRAAMCGEPFLYAGAISALIRDYLMRSRQNDPPAREHPHPARGGDRQADRRGQLVQGDRRDAGDQHQDRGPAPGEHPGQAGHARPPRPHPLRHPRGPGRTLISRRA
jgi:DNA-binding NarL/FixJ family response regulator